MADSIEQFKADQDIFSKINCLIGYLEMWEQGKAKPDYLPALVKESEEWLEGIKQQSSPIFSQRRAEVAEDVHVFKLFISRTFEVVCPGPERMELEKLLEAAENIIAKYTLGGGVISQKNNTLNLTR